VPPIASDSIEGVIDFSCVKLGHKLSSGFISFYPGAAEDLRKAVFPIDLDAKCGSGSFSSGWFLVEVRF
jgi:hypothetical protein